MKAKKASSAKVSAIRILKIGNCPSLSGKSTLTYHVGCKGTGDIQFRIYANDGGGFHSNEWVALSEIQRTLGKAETVTSAMLHPIFKGKSANSGGFLLAALKHEGLFARSADNPRSYAVAESPAFMSEVQALIDAAVDLDPESKPGQKTVSAKKTAGKALTKTEAETEPVDTEQKAPDSEVT